MNVSNVNVEVLGRQFSISVPDDEQLRLRQAVSMLNQKIATLEEQGRIAETESLVILASLNLAHDFLKMKTTDGLDFSSLENRIESLIDLCDNTVKSIQEKSS